MTIYDASSQIQIRAILDVALKTKMTVNLSQADVNWEADTVYRFELSDNFVKDVNGVRSQLVAIPTLASINSGPIRMSVTSTFNCNVTIIRNRGFNIATTSNFNNVTSGSARRRAISSLNSFFTTNTNNYSEYFLGGIKIAIDDYDQISGMNLFQVANNQVKWLNPLIFSIYPNPQLDNINLGEIVSKNGPNDGNPTCILSNNGVQIVLFEKSSSGPMLMKIFNKNNDRPTLNNTITLPDPAANQRYSQVTTIRSQSDYYAVYQHQAVDTNLNIVNFVPKIRLYDKTFNLLQDLTLTTTPGEYNNIDGCWDLSETFLAIKYKVSEVSVYSRSGSTLSKLVDVSIPSSDLSSSVCITNNGSFMYLDRINSVTKQTEILIYQKSGNSYNLVNTVTQSGGVGIVNMTLSNNQNTLAVIMRTNTNSSTNPNTQLIIYNRNSSTGALTLVTSQSSYQSTDVVWSSDDSIIAINGTKVSDIPFRFFNFNGQTLGELSVLNDTAIRSSNTVVANANARISTAQKVKGKGSAIFDGIDDYLEVVNPNFNLATTTNWTIDFIFRPTNVTKFSVIAQGYISDNKRNWLITLGNGILRYYISSNGTSWNIANGIQIHSNAISVNTWYHFSLEKNNTSYSVDLVSLFDAPNPALQYNTVASNTAVFNSQENIRVGNSGLGSNGFAGYIDYFRISNIWREVGNPGRPMRLINDPYTYLLLQMLGENNSTNFIDENGSYISIATDEFYDKVSSYNSITFAKI